MTNGRKRFLYLYLLALSLGLVVAGTILFRFGFDFYQGGDSPGYMILAKNLAEQGTLSFDGQSPFAPTNFRTPGYPLFLALIYLIFHSFVPAIFLGAIIAAFAAPLIYLIARELLSESVALAAGAMAALEPMGLFLGVSILTEGVFTPVLLLSVYFFIRYLKSGAGNYYLWYSAIFLGAAALVRPIMFYFWPFAVLFIVFKERKIGRRPLLKGALIFIALFFLILSPWLIRNKLTVNSWQITGLQGYIFFIDHYGAVLRYLGEAGPLSDVQAKALSIVGPDKIFTSEGSDALFATALNGVKTHKLAYANIYAKSIISFFMANGYKSLFIDILGIPAQAPYIPFELFLRFDIKAIAQTLGDMDFAGALIYWGSKILWVVIFCLFIGGFVYLLFSQNYKSIRVETVFITAVIFYFALITGPTAIGGGRTKAPINGLIFIFTAFSAVNLIKSINNETPDHRSKI